MIREAGERHHASRVGPFLVADFRIVGNVVRDVGSGVGDASYLEMRGARARGRRDGVEAAGLQLEQHSLQIKGPNTARSCVR